MKKIQKLFTPTSIIILSLLIVTIFLRYYLFIHSNQLVKEFQNQNYKEIYAIDTLKITSRLNSLSNVINWVCIKGEHGGQVFYSMAKGDCSSGLFKQNQTLYIPEANDIKISFTTRLPKEFEIFFLIFFLSQSLLLVAIIKSTRLYENQKHINERERIKLARQMSHDIRSPLATLHTVIDDMELISTQSRKLIIDSIERINTIANSLLKETRKAVSSDDLDNKLPLIKEVSLAELIQDVVDHKNIEFSKIPNLEIRFLNSINSPATATLDEGELKRIFSNLINNSKEANNSNEKKIISIELFQELNEAVITIQDNASGIPEHILNKIGKEEITLKKNGNGIGLLHAFESVKRFGGDLTIKSSLSGTLVSIKIPVKSSHQQLDTVLIDDDELVRLTWKASASKRSQRLKTYSNAKDFLNDHLDFSRDINIYIDSNLSDGIKGEDIALELHQKGFLNISITSGHEKERFSSLVFLKEVRGKKPPWS